MLVILILALGLVTVVGSGALWVYKTAPVDGVRDPLLSFYPDANFCRNRRHGIRHPKEVRSDHGNKATRWRKS